MIDFNLTEEQQMLRDVVQRYVRDHYDLERHRKSAASSDGFQRSHWKTFAELGWLGLSLDEEVGGLGCSFLEVAIVMEEFGRGLVLEPFLPTAVLCAHLLDRAGGGARGKEILRELSAGKMFLALAHVESGAGFDIACVNDTVARRSAQGYRLEGVKTLVLGGPSADQLIVSARIEDDAQGRFGLFLVDPYAPGVTMSHYPLLDFTRASDVTLCQVEVGPDAMLAGPDDGLRVLDEAVDLATLATVAEALGCMEAILQLCSDYLKTRVQFGKPLGQFQASQHRMAEMFIEAQETRSILLQGITSLGQGEQARRTAVSAAKAYAGQAAKIIGTLGVQLHGGIGVTVEAPVGHYYKKLVMFEKLFGDTDYHVERFAAAMN